MQTSTRRITAAVAMCLVFTALAVMRTTSAFADQTDQRLEVTVTGGTLNQFVATTAPNAGPTSARLTPTSSDTAVIRMTGALNTVTVTDTRGGGLGWSLTASVTDFSDGVRVISKSRLVATPHCSARSPRSAPGYAAGPAGQSAGAPVMLCSKDGELGDAGSTGGSYDVGADLRLDVPTTQAPGEYTAIVTLLLV